MRVLRTGDGRVSILDVSADQFAVLVDAVGDLNRQGNPHRPFSGDFQRWVDGVVLALSQGCKLFRMQRGKGGLGNVFHLVPPLKKPTPL